MKDRKKKESPSYNWEVRHLDDQHPDVGSIKIKNIPEPKGMGQNKVDPDTHRDLKR